ncbi:MAG: 4-hydroxybenzoate octaprenyltransferase, partial [Pseudomonadota bacterium]
ILTFYLASLALALASWRAAHLGPAFLPLAALLAVWLIRQPLRLRLADPAGALALFKSNTVAGLLLFAALVAGHWRW